MEIHVIYDNRPLPDKMIELKEEFEDQNIVPTKIWEPVDAKSVVESINATHKAIVRYAKEKGLKEVCIIEDDLFFPGHDGWEYFLKNKPEDFDIYIAGTYYLDGPDTWKPPVVKVKAYVGNHLIIVSEKYYDKFLSVPDNSHIDTAQEGLGDFYVCFPMAALQRPGFSSNARIKVNYNTMLRSEWIHK